MQAAPPAAASPSAKLGGSGHGLLSLTANAGTSSPVPLPAYLFAEPTPPSRAAVAAWGTQVAGFPDPQAPGPAVATVASRRAQAPAPGQDLFADFSPFN